jgi:hypothetical protein
VIHIFFINEGNMELFVRAMPAQTTPFSTAGCTAGGMEEVLFLDAGDDDTLDKQALRGKEEDHAGQHGH